MKMKLALILLTSLLTVACSRQDRYAEAPLDGEELYALLDEIIPSATGMSVGLEETIYGPTSVIYFGQGEALTASAPATESQQSTNDDQNQAPVDTLFDQPGVMGWPENIFAFNNFDFIFSGLGWEDLLAARVFFITDEENGQYGLITDVELSSEGEDKVGTQYLTTNYLVASDAEITVDKISQTRKFEITFEHPQTGQLIYLRTFDLTNTSKFKPVIQLEVFTTDEYGELWYSGKFSYLVGYE